MTLNGRALSEGADYRVAREGDAVVVWLNLTLNGAADVSITSRATR